MILRHAALRAFFNPTLIVASTLTICTLYRKYGIMAMVCYKLQGHECVDDARLTHIWHPD